MADEDVPETAVVTLTFVVAPPNEKPPREGVAAAELKKGVGQ